jgi:hypothetical protein
MEELLDINLKNLYFKKVKNTLNIKNYMILNKDNHRHKIILKNINIPFGPEKYNNSTILNIEIDPKKDNIHYNYKAIIQGFENELSKINNFYDKKLIVDIENKGYYPNLRESKIGYIVRTCIFTPPEVYGYITGRDKSVKIKNKMSMQDVCNIKANIELELGSLWINENNYGITWYVKSIEILYSL